MKRRRETAISDLAHASQKRDGPFLFPRRSHGCVEAPEVLVLKEIKTSAFLFSNSSSTSRDRFRIYTKKGDTGQFDRTSRRLSTNHFLGLSYNFAGQRLPKDHPIFEALGANDELTSALGCEWAWQISPLILRTFVVRLAYQFCEESRNDELTKKLERVQCILQDIGSNIATPRDKTMSQRKLGARAFAVWAFLV